MKTLLILGFILCPSLLIGGQGMRAMKGDPPNEEMIGEILSDVQDAGENGFENHVLTEAELSRFLSDGRFTTTLDARLAEVAKREEKSAQGGPIYCSGVFATKDGRVDKFRRYNKQVLQIIGVSGGGWLVIEGRFQAGRGDADKPPNWIGVLRAAPHLLCSPGRNIPKT